MLPSRNESALYRRKSDERVELFGTPCTLWRQSDLDTPVSFDPFDNLVVTGPAKRGRPTRVILEYQKEKSTIAERSRDIKDFPFVATFRFADRVRRGDIFEVSYEYAQAAGLLNYCKYYGAEAGPTTTTSMRFKIVDRRTSGVNADLRNSYNVVPTEESWS